MVAGFSRGSVVPRLSGGVCPEAEVDVVSPDRPVANNTMTQRHLRKLRDIENALRILREALWSATHRRIAEINGYILD